MSDEEHSDSEFYYPDDEQEEYDTSFHQFFIKRRTTERTLRTSSKTLKTARKKL